MVPDSEFICPPQEASAPSFPSFTSYSSQGLKVRHKAFWFSQAKLPLPKLPHPRGLPTSYLHPKGLHPGGDLSPDSAQTKNSEGLPAQLCSHELQPSRQRSQRQSQAWARGPGAAGPGQPLTFFRSHLPFFIEAVAWGICLQGHAQVQWAHADPRQPEEEA